MSMTLGDIRKELGRLKELEAELLHRVAATTEAEKIEALADAQPKINPKTRAMAALLEAGYGMSKDEAEAIIKERQAEPQSHPYTEYKKAQAFMAAYEAKPVVTSQRAGWRRTRG